MAKPKTISKTAFAGAGLRAKERVLAYLEKEFSREDAPEHARLPTSRALAKQLGVSVSTVQTALRMLAAQGVVRTELGNGCFLIKPPRKAGGTLRLGVTFGISEGGASPELWQLGISGSILKHAAQMEGHASVVPIPIPQRDIPGTLAALEAHRERMDGVIIRSSSELKRAWEASSLRQMPLVSLNPPSLSATSNFVSADYLEAYIQVGAALLAGGRRNIVFMGNLPGELENSDVLRCAGLLKAMGAKVGSEVHFEIVSAKGHLEQDGYDLTRDLMARRKLRPDAIVAAGDMLAIGTRQACLDRGISVPEEVSIIGGTGADLNTYPAMAAITRARQPLEQIGVELVEMLRRLIQTSGQPQPGIFLPIVFEGGHSTLPEENAVLGIGG